LGFDSAPFTIANPSSIRQTTYLVIPSVQHSIASSDTPAAGNRRLANPMGSRNCSGAKLVTEKIQTEQHGK